MLLLVLTSVITVVHGYWGVTNHCVDFDSSSRVDISDLANMLASWGSCQCRHDLDGDATVDVADLAEFLLHWGFALECTDPLDINVDGVFDIKDVVRVLAQVYRGEAVTVSEKIITSAFLGEIPQNPNVHSVVRRWNDVLLQAIRDDQARPTVTARNLWHFSTAVYDAWAAFDPDAEQIFHVEKTGLPRVHMTEVICYAAYTLLAWRYQENLSPGHGVSQKAFRALMVEFGFPLICTGGAACSLGERIAATIIEFGRQDGSNEDNNYQNIFYETVNPPLAPERTGNPDIIDRNRWQPLALEVFVGQSGQVMLGGAPPFQSPEWGQVAAFALTNYTSANRCQSDGEFCFDYWVYEDPGAPPRIGFGAQDAELYLSGFEQVMEFSSALDPTDGVMIDISPNAKGANTLGANDGNGRSMNPKTGEPYTPNIVPAGDYFRVLAEFWADGIDSETPPGHWFVILNYVSDLIDTKRFENASEPMGNLEWDIKSYVSLGAALHDSAVAAWGAKGRYDYIRPISALRAMCARGQRSDPNRNNFHADGIRLEEGRVELVDGSNCGRFGLAFCNKLGTILVRAWKGPEYIDNPSTDEAGVGWIECSNWWPYQRPTFVTPPFAAYVSGHSTFSRAAAEVMTQVTGDEYFPGGMGTFHAQKNEYLVFEEGPSVNVTLQWATYRDASDECSISRIYGGIHPTQDDIPGRFMGAKIGPLAVNKVKERFNNPTIAQECASICSGPQIDPCIDALLAGCSQQGLPSNSTQQQIVIHLRRLLLRQ